MSGLLRTLRKAWLVILGYSCLIGALITIQVLGPVAIAWVGFYILLTLGVICVLCGIARFRRARSHDPA